MFTRVSSRERAVGHEQDSRRAFRGDLVHIDERIIREVARRRGPRGPIAWLWLKRLGSETVLRFVRHVDFRARSARRAAKRYQEMQPDDLEQVNAVQAWANWRTIPRNLDGLLPARPLQVVDLCCGIGESTEVLAWYCPPGSQILGLEVVEGFVQTARRRRYVDRDGEPVEVRFRAQDVLEPFCHESGTMLEAESVDLVHAIGAVGAHFRPAESRQIAAECRRVLVDGGLALLDCGAKGTPGRELQSIFEHCGFVYLRKSTSCLADRYWQMVFQKRGGGSAASPPGSRPPD